MEQHPTDRVGGSSSARRLRRSRDNKVIAGVCAGVADYFSIDPVIVRIAFVVLAVGGGGGLLAYIIAWAVLPEEGSDTAPLTTAFSEPKEKIAIALGASLIAIGVLILLAPFTSIVFQFGGPAVMILIGAALVVSALKR